MNIWRDLTSKQLTTSTPSPHTAFFIPWFGWDRVNFPCRSWQSHVLDLCWKLLPTQGCLSYCRADLCSHLPLRAGGAQSWGHSQAQGSPSPSQQDTELGVPAEVALVMAQHLPAHGKWESIHSSALLLGEAVPLSTELLYLNTLPLPILSPIPLGGADSG